MPEVLPFGFHREMFEGASAAYPSAIPAPAAFLKAASSSKQVVLRAQVPVNTRAARCQSPSIESATPAEEKPLPLRMRHRAPGIRGPTCPRSTRHGPCGAQSTSAGGRHRRVAGASAATTVPAPDQKGIALLLQSIAEPKLRAQLWLDRANLSALR